MRYGLIKVPNRFKNRVKKQKPEQTIPDVMKRVRIVAVIAILCVFIAVILLAREKFSIDSIVEIGKNYNFFSIFIIILLFALKSLTVFLPCAPLFVADGLLFSPVLAVVVSLTGFSIAVTIPYLLGKWSGENGIRYLRDKYPKIDKILAYQQKNELMTCLVLRIIGILPCDIVSFYFGACKTNYKSYIIASVFGSALSVITTTLLGEVVLNPFSKEFILLVIIKVLLSAGAVVLTYIFNRSKKK